MINVVIHATDTRVAGILEQILTSTSPISAGDPATTWVDLRRSIAMQAGTVVVLGPDTADADLARVPAAIHDYPGTSFVYVADALDASTLQRAMRNGVRDVVAVADAESDLPAAVMRAHAFAQSDGPASNGKSAPARGKAVAVLGAKGGTGKTMLATNLAVLAAKSGVSTVLVDACVVFGDCSAVLRVRPSHSITDLVGAAAVDEALVGGLLAEHDSGLDVLAAPNDPLAAEDLDAQTLTEAIDCLKRSHELVVVDTGPGLGAYALAAYAESELCFLITSLELPAVKDAKMMLNVLSHRARSVDDHVQVVLNRADSKVGFPPDEVARALGRRAAVELPSDVAVPRSINNGVVVALESPKSRIGKALTRLSTDMRGDLFGKENASRRKSLLRVPRARAASL
jgi:pilus assembly protein CpaE